MKKIKLFFTTHSILALLIFTFGSWFLIARFDDMSKWGFVFWFTMVSVITTLMILVWYNMNIRSIRLDSETMTVMWYWIIGSIIVDCICGGVSQELGGYVFLGIFPAVIIGFILNTVKSLRERKR